MAILALTSKMRLMSVLEAIPFDLDILFENIKRKWHEFGLNRVFQPGKEEIRDMHFWPKK